MAIKSVESIIDHKPKRTSQGGKKPKMSSMNKDKRRKIAEDHSYLYNKHKNKQYQILNRNEQSNKNTEINSSNKNKNSQDKNIEYSYDDDHDIEKVFRHIEQIKQRKTLRLGLLSYDFNEHQIWRQKTYKAIHIFFF